MPLRIKNILTGNQEDIYTYAQLSFYLTAKLPKEDQSKEALKTTEDCIKHLQTLIHLEANLATCYLPDLKSLIKDFPELKGKDFSDIEDFHLDVAAIRTSERSSELEQLLLKYNSSTICYLNTRSDRSKHYTKVEKAEEKNGFLLLYLESISIVRDSIIKGELFVQVQKYSKYHQVTSLRTDNEIPEEEYDRVRISIVAMADSL